jgi:hypothetical protein
MAVVSLIGFRTAPGKLAGHLAASAEALGHLRRLGLRAVSLQAIAGTDVGTVATAINYVNNVDHVTSLQKVMGDQAWQEFWGRASAEASAVQVESSLFADVDASFQPAEDRPLGVILGTQWRARPGRMMDFMSNVMTSMPHIARMGGLARPMQCLVGAHPMTTMVATTFTDLDAWGAYADKAATDEQWQAFWAGAMTDPTADLIRSTLYVNISGD